MTVKRSPVIFILFFLMISCEKNSLPYLDNTKVSDITMYSAVVKGYVFEEGNSLLLSKGICWDSTGNPTTDDFVLRVESIGNGISGKITYLLPGQKYYVRCFATNKSGTAYSPIEEFTTIPVGIPAIGTMDVHQIKIRSAVTGVAVSGNSAVYVTKKGVCYGTEPNPTVENSVVREIPGAGWYYTTLNSLSSATTYYVRGFATTKAGTGYGEELHFTTYRDSVADIEGRYYYTTTLGNEEWLGSNLCVTRYNNGDPIGTTEPSFINIEQEAEPKYQWAYLGDESKVPDYGRYYTWHAVNDSRKLCPAGWHIPTDEEWADLINWYGGELKAGDPMKLISILWDIYHLPIYDDSGFNAIGSGYRKPDGAFMELRQSANFWSSASLSGTEAYSRRIEGLTPAVTRAASSKSSGFSVRCVRD
jgi:uncharacterized protein (TIGR02145 family)